jgi:hypothetical protein
MTQRAMKVWSTGDATISNTYLNNRKVGWQYDADGRPTTIDGFYRYDAAGRNNYLEVSGPTLPTATMTYDGDGRQIKTIETSIDENLQTLSETKYYLRSTVLGGKVLTEFESNAGIWRSFVYAGPAVLGWIWQAYGADMMNWEQRDPSGATVRGHGEQELDPLGADAGTFATSVPPTEDAIVSPGNPYNPAHPNFTYSIDGIRVPVEDFVHHAGIILKDPLAMMDWLARKSATPIGKLSVGVSFGHKAAIIFDANGKSVYEKWWYDSELSDVSYGSEYYIYRNAVFNPTLIPQKPGFNENGIRDGLKKALSNPDCAKLIDALLNAVATKKNPLVSQYGQGGIMGMFEAVILEDGLTRTAPPGSAGYGSPIGNIAQGDAAIFVGSVPFGPADQLQVDVKGVLGELMHLGGQRKYYTDRAFAEVVHRDYPGLSRSIWPGDKNYKFHKDAQKNPNHIGWSYYFHYAVNKTCF